VDERIRARTVAPQARPRAAGVVGTRDCSQGPVLRPSTRIGMACFPWSEREKARMATVLSDPGCSAPSPRFPMVCTVAQSRSLLSYLASRTRAHHALASRPHCQSELCLHLRHRHHAWLPQHEIRGETATFTRPSRCASSPCHLGTPNSSQTQHVPLTAIFQSDDARRGSWRGARAAFEPSPVGPTGSLPGLEAKNVL
jgi:hypothetical protein